MPKDHTALLKLLNAKPDVYKGKITAYDPEKSGVGYLFCQRGHQGFPAGLGSVQGHAARSQAKLYTWPAP